MHWLEHVEAAILYLTPIIGIVVVILNFNPINLLLLLILLLIWKIANGAL
jgi:hypothetical protein